LVRSNVSNRFRRIALALGAAGLLAAPLVLDLRVQPVAQPLGEGWRSALIASRGSTRLGASFRPRQVEALGLDAKPTLQSLLNYPIQLIRLGAYWNRIEPASGVFDAGDLDWQIEAAARAGVPIILAVGALKTFGYPEFYVPAHRLARPLPEGRLVTPETHPSLLAAATEHVTRMVEHYQHYAGIVAWQVEHEAVDPLGAEHSWRLAVAFVEKEVEAVRRADPSRPIVLNGFFHSSLIGALGQWWQTRDQGDSLALAQRLADVVGADYYPRYALASLGTRSLYLDGTASLLNRRRRKRLLDWARESGRKLMVTEGQAEPWEAVTIPPSVAGSTPCSCGPAQVIENYNAWRRSAEGDMLDAYLFWGAEYWLLRAKNGDPGYLRAFERILELA
jgi:beta-galactosidase GanA